jgi:type VI secretion system secreted protein Hcp
MATSTYLKCDPIKGESTDDQHADWIEVTSFSHRLDQPTSGASGTGGRGAARADFGSFEIQKSVDKASVDLNIFCAKGKHITKVELEVYQGGEEKVCYLKYVLENAMIQSISMAGGGSDRPRETVNFVYGKISWEYTSVSHEGVVGTKIGPKVWNLQTNETE